jgi:hypothetical protein
VFSASDDNLRLSWDTAPPKPPIWVEVKKFGWEEIGLGKALFVIPDGWSIVFMAVVVLKPDSTLWIPPWVVGEMVMFFSSTFEANSNVGDGLDPPFAPRDWKLSAGLSLFLCFELKNVNQFLDGYYF